MNTDWWIQGGLIVCKSCVIVLLARPWNAARRVWTVPEAKGTLDTFVEETLFQFVGLLNASIVFKHQ